MGYETASHMALFTSVAEVIGGVLGGKDEKPKPKEDLTRLAPEQYSNRLEQLMSL